MQSPSVPERFRPLLEATAELAERFIAAGRSLYLVGGSVRDALFPAGAQADPDFDLTTDARPDEIERLVSGWADDVWTQGARFGTIGCRRGDHVYEITTHRAEVYVPDSRKPEVTFGDDVEADLSRRDFTINAMALRLPDMELLDPFDGLGDFAAGRLRTPLDPEISFGDDPLRMLRAARFAARFSLKPDPALEVAVEAMHERLSIVSRERIRDELDKIVMIDVPSEALWFVVRTGLAADFMPELPGLALEQDPIHRHKDVLAHTLAVVDKTSPVRLLRLAALFHDVGKPKTRAITNGGVTFHHHEMVGARMTRTRMTALRYSAEDIDTVVRLVELHLRFHTYRLGWTDKAVRRYVRDAGPLLDLLNELTRCDCTTRNASKARALARRMDELEARITELGQQEELDRLRPDLTGNQVMELLGVPPGPVVGQALGFLMELRLDEGPLSEEEATARLREWWAGQQQPPQLPPRSQRGSDPGSERPNPSDLVSTAMEITLLGTGSPLPNPDRAGPATLVRAGGATMLFDCGRGVIMRMTAAGVLPIGLSAVFLTHLHSDHITDLNDIVTTHWVMSPEPSPLMVVGPPGTQRVVDGVLAMLALDQDYRLAHHANLTERPLINVVEVEPGAELALADATVSVHRTDHRPVTPTVGYRVEHEGAVAAIAGDTVPCAELDELCRDADLYVQTVIRADLVRAIPNARLQDILDYHSTVEQAAQTATRAGVKTLVLTHYVPPMQPGDEEAWRALAAAHFTGPIVLGDDLTVVSA